ncbi:hypothetical protein [Nocardioides deserti]|uniref:Uncharacterized protein n=1 Tax=Nocardioides deserti TaxID=1588644 RepID=A0ABR6UBX1_9ACTN|nr:hypothetical protein [Nocardioides deserti]MBC2961331.1 hypothetical protein [Nocardioides deserti]GGO72432.1 hypothetical protein GCM10012276_15780 [Nocardioides deserti]
MKRSEELRTQAQHVVSFRDGYMQLIGLSRIVHDEVFYSHRLRVPKQGHEAEYFKLMATVARAAGHAQVGPGGVLHGIANWKQSLDDIEALSAADVIETCESVIGMLEGQATVLERRDRTLAGRVAAFVGFPSRVRAIAAQDYPGLQKAAFGVGIAGQVLVGVMVAVLAAGVIAVIAALWRVIA